VSDIAFITTFLEHRDSDDKSSELNPSLGCALVRSNSPASKAIDTSGIENHNGGDWIRNVWKVKRLVNMIKKHEKKEGWKCQNTF
jgi:hypothetical protein